MVSVFQTLSYATSEVLCTPSLRLTLDGHDQRRLGGKCRLSNIDSFRDLGKTGTFAIAAFGQSRICQTVEVRNFCAVL